MRARKGQEEMVGFVVIVVLVLVVGMVFLGLFFKRGGTETPSTRAENFLNSAMLYSTECSSSPERVYDVRELFKACYNNEICGNGRRACEVLNSTLDDLLSASFFVGNESYTKGYEFRAKRIEGDDMVYLKKGSLRGALTGARTTTYDRNVNISIRLWS